MSMKLTPSSTARRSAARAGSRSGGSPQIPGPVTRIAPNPIRLTVRSPPMLTTPAAAALTLSGWAMRGFPSREFRRAP